MMVLVPFTTQCREAAVTLLKEYAEDASVKLQTYRARPASVNAPCAFVDRVRESVNYLAAAPYQRNVTVEVVVLWGLFDSGDAVDQRDRFVDGFLQWQSTRFHQAGANTTIGVSGIEDDPGYVNDWMKPETQRTYYATRISLEGFAGG
jgi:hypothetical protein